MIINIIIIVILSIASVAVSIFSITGSLQLWRVSVLRKLGSWWRHKDFTSGNKWKNGDKKNRERFPGSSTFLSSFTDALHASVLVSILGFSMAGVLTGLKLYGVTDVGVIIETIMIWVITYSFVFNYTHHYVLMTSPIPSWQIIGGLLTCIIIGALGLQFGLFDNGWIFFWIIAPVFVYAVLVVIRLIYVFLKIIVKKILNFWKLNKNLNNQ